MFAIISCTERVFAPGGKTARPLEAARSWKGTGMDPEFVVGLIAAAVAGFLLADRLPGRSKSDNSERPFDRASKEPTPAEVVDEVRRMRLEHDEWLDKMEHLYGRIRKRAKVRDDEDLPANGPMPHPVLTAPPLTREALMAEAFQKGLTIANFGRR